MTYTQLADFIDNRMRMSHIYQPVMLITLLEHGGRLKDSEIAKSLLAQDQSQIEYYTSITNNMPGKVLRKHEIVTRDRSAREYTLKGFEALSADEINSLKEKAIGRLDAYLEKRGSKIFDHRRKSSGYISGTIRYEVLKRAQFHCELCGISADQKALEVDHILPRNSGGSDDLSNLQALCYSCNSMKRDRDDTDFRAVREAFARKEVGCTFCEIPQERIKAENELAYVIADKFAVTKGHCLIIPRRHTASYFDLGQAEINAVTSLLKQQRKIIAEKDKAVTGFNVGVNDGQHSGQTIMHCHIHLIPRRKGDMADPTGGVRHVIPERGNYKTGLI